MNKYILDFDKLKKNHLSIGEFKILIDLYEGSNKQTIADKYIEHKGFIKIIDKNTTILREKGKQFIESCIYKEHQEELDIKLQSFADKYLVNKKDNFEDFIKEYRNIWKGLKIGSQGNAKSCSEKMQRWMKENPNYSQDDIIRAANTYINSLDDFKYLQKADYFIYKKDKFGETSRLSDYIDEDEVKESGWSSVLK